MIKMGSLFSGIGGFELGLERAIPGLKTVWQVEQDKFCQRVLQKHWADAKLYDDVRTINKNNVEPVDIICGGFPCQDVSIAGKGEGLNGKRSGLWWEMRRIIGELQPRIAVMENVSNLVIRGLPEVLGSLSEIGYDSEWCVISAADFGAPHKRSRVFIVAYPHKANSKEQSIHTWGMEKNGSKCRSGENAPSNSNSEPYNSKSEIFPGRQKPAMCNDRRENYWRGFPTQSPICNRNDGISYRLARLRALGNAIVPQCSEWIGEQIWNSGLLNDLLKQELLNDEK